MWREAHHAGEDSKNKMAKEDQARSDAAQSIKIGQPVYLARINLHRRGSFHIVSDFRMDVARQAKPTIGRAEGDKAGLGMNDGAAS